MMFTGAYEQKIDEKSRVVLPATFRSDLEYTKLILAAGEHGEIGVWPVEEWKSRCLAIQAGEYDSDEGAKKFRKFTKNAAEVKLDAQFRFVIPENLRRLAALTDFGTSQPLVLAGAMNRLEIWERSRYLAFFDEGGE
jgi:MraZ protein